MKHYWNNFKFNFSNYLSPLLLGSCCFVSTLNGEDEPKLKAYDELANNLWTDHVTHFSKLFDLYKVESFLEFGGGEGTQYFLKNCGHVTSFDFLANHNKQKTLSTFESCKSLYSDFSNWSPSTYECSQSLNRALEIAEKRLNPASFEQEYLDEIDAICEVLFSERDYDVAFVDPSIVTRGDIVNALFDRVKIIVAHDVSFHGEIYGWKWVNSHPDYEKISFSNGSGTSFWVHKDLTDVIEGLKSYAND